MGVQSRLVGIAGSLRVPLRYKFFLLPGQEFEVVEAHLRRIEDVNPKLLAVVQLVEERALQEARAADEALAKGESKGLPHGVPMTIKDSLDTAGVISAGGTKGRASFVPEMDAVVVSRMRGAEVTSIGV